MRLWSIRICNLFIFWWNPVVPYRAKILTFYKMTSKWLWRLITRKWKYVLGRNFAEVNYKLYWSRKYIYMGGVYENIMFKKLRLENFLTILQKNPWIMFFWSSLGTFKNSIMKPIPNKSGMLNRYFTIKSSESDENSSRKKFLNQFFDHSKNVIFWWCDTRTKYSDEMICP